MMLYLIGGASRAGKTTVARRILKARGVPYFSLDWIVMGFTNGMPACEIHDKLFPDEIADRLSGFLDAMVRSMIWEGGSCAVEGEAMLPELIRNLADDHPGEVQSCFLGYDSANVDIKVDEIRSFSQEQRDWLTKEPNAYIRDHVQNMILFSKKVRHQCEKHGVRYFDASNEFCAVLDKATEFLLSGSADS